MTTSDDSHDKNTPAPAEALSEAGGLDLGPVAQTNPVPDTTENGVQKPEEQASLNTMQQQIPGAFPRSGHDRLAREEARDKDACHSREEQPKNSATPGHVCILPQVVLTETQIVADAAALAELHRLWELQQGRSAA